MTKKSSNVVTKQYDEFAEDYAIAQTNFYTKFSDESRKTFYNELNFSLKNKKVLDAGCGFGKEFSFLKKRGAITYGIDSSEKMIEFARKNNPNSVNLSVQSFENTNFNDLFFDIIISRYALHCAENIEDVLKELHRILKHKGFLVFLAAHPLLGFMAKRNKNYSKKEIVEIPLYDGEFIVKEPTHTFSEYLNPFMLKNFKIISFYESPGLENKHSENNFKEIVPDFFVMKLRKK